MSDQDFKNAFCSAMDFFPLTSEEISVSTKTIQVPTGMLANLARQGLSGNIATVVKIDANPEKVREFAGCIQKRIKEKTGQIPNRLLDGSFEIIGSPTQIAAKL
tara:strand:+ start:231 stop:542 length:312 start_codon:yes stop_codon:yes gene_type:complete